MITAVQSRMARAALNVGGKEVAAAAGITIQTLSRFECGIGEAKMSTLRAIAEYYESRGCVISSNGRTVIAPEGE